MKRQIAIAIATAILLLPILANAAASVPIHLDKDKFQQWLVDFKTEAIKSGISKTVLDGALNDITPLARVIELDRKQPEFTQTFRQYINNVVPKSRVIKARKKFKKHNKLLNEVSQKYGVQKRFIVALWGVESDFGERMGNYNIIESLATLAFDGRRSAFFRKELLNALQIMQEQNIPSTKMKGSWAGAMGQTQFMPSSYLAYAQDHDGNNKKDIWATQADVFSSIANYLKNTGWNDNQTWGRRVKLPENFDKSLVKQSKDLEDWRKLGVKKADGSALPNAGGKFSAKLVMPGKKSGEDDAFLVYANYDRILKWNRSDYFATAVGYLSDALR